MKLPVCADEGSTNHWVVVNAILSKDRTSADERKFWYECCTKTKDASVFYNAHYRIRQKILKHAIKSLKKHAAEKNQC